MNIEVMIYVYMGVCTAMILFNGAVVLVNGRQKRRVEQLDHKFTPRISAQIRRLEQGCAVESAHLQWLERKLRRLGALRAFDADLEAVEQADPEKADAYLRAIRPVFLSLAVRYSNRETLQAAYFAYVVRKYHLARHGSFDSMTEVMLSLVANPSVYARENALHIIYQLGDPSCVFRALKILDNYRAFHHPKLIHDGLLEFTGSRDALLSLLWQELKGFSYEMQTTLVNYIRLSGGGCDRQVFLLMTEPGQDDEVYFACMRYFGRFSYAPAYPILLEDLRKGENRRWELAAVAATVLRNYPGERTIDLLKAALHSSVWYVRANAAESLEALGVTYVDLVEVFEGDDRYAREILQYRMDYRKAKGKETASV